MIIHGDDVLMTPNETAQYLGISRTTLWNWSKRLGFPAPFEPTTRTLYYRKSEIDAWLESSRSGNKAPSSGNGSKPMTQLSFA